MRQAVFSRLSSVQKAHLRELTILFSQRKRFRGADGLILTQPMVWNISAYACLLVLELGLDYYEDWRDIIVYPSAFMVERDEADEMGVVWHQQAILDGEAWLSGPVVLNWQDFNAQVDNQTPGRNLVVHEMAHKLDMLNGRANGMPPLHATMQREHWTQALSEGFERLQHKLADGQRVLIDPYAATDPAEFFAVCSEYFFTAPHQLKHHFAAVYQQLSLFYGQDPLLRVG